MLKFTTMSLTPFTREQLRAFKAQKDEECHTLKIESIVKQMYVETVLFAERNGETAHRIKCNKYAGVIHLQSNIPAEQHTVILPSTYVVEHMEEILDHLQDLFPNCTVEYKKVAIAKGKDGKEFDISKLDDHILQLIDIRQSTTEEYIVIDWS